MIRDEIVFFTIPVVMALVILGTMSFLIEKMNDAINKIEPEHTSVQGEKVSPMYSPRRVQSGGAEHWP